MTHVTTRPNSKRSCDETNRFTRSWVKEGWGNMGGYHSVQVRKQLRQQAFQVRIAMEGWIHAEAQLLVVLRLRRVGGKIEWKMATRDLRWGMIDDAEERTRIEEERQPHVLGDHFVLHLQR